VTTWAEGGAHRPRQLDSGHPRHRVVNHEHVDPSAVAADQVQRGLAAGGLHDLVPERFQLSDSHLTYVLLIVDHEHGRRCPAAALATPSGKMAVGSARAELRGKYTSTVVPWPTALLILRLPPDCRGSP
jgi:hypothetical protein